MASSLFQTVRDALQTIHSTIKIGSFYESTFSYNEYGFVKADGPEMDNPGKYGTQRETWSNARSEEVACRERHRPAKQATLRKAVSSTLHMTSSIRFRARMVSEFKCTASKEFHSQVFLPKLTRSY